MEKMKPEVVAIGEILWDIFPDDKRIGGAPANFVYYITKLGIRTALASRVGQDSLGVQALAACRAAGLVVDFIQKDLNHPTGTVRVELDDQGSPKFQIDKNVAWDYLEEEEPLFSLAERARAIYFGTLAQRHHQSRKVIQQLLARARAGCLKVLDINLRTPFYDREVIKFSLQAADVLKLNSDELRIVSSLFSLKGEKSQILRALMEKFSLQVIALTMGSEGSLIMTRERESKHPGYLVKVVDTVGAGDAFTAGLVEGILKGIDLDEIGKFANQLASFVCSRSGAWVNISDIVRPAS
uniref:carbohydrate kinase family protein n=1 Tax=Candidatus Saccharicenans sp. TaxID=2819258 RepID=UPI004049D872